MVTMNKKGLCRIKKIFRQMGGIEHMNCLSVVRFLWNPDRKTRRNGKLRQIKK